MSGSGRRTKKVRTRWNPSLRSYSERGFAEQQRIEYRKKRTHSKTKKAVRPERDHRGNIIYPLNRNFGDCMRAAARMGYRVDPNKREIFYLGARGNRPGLGRVKGRTVKVYTSSIGDGWDERSKLIAKLNGLIEGFCDPRYQRP